MELQRLNEPTENQRKYLGLLLSRAHERGIPYLPIETLSRSQVSAWIDYLKTVVDEGGANSSPSPRCGSFGYRPAFSVLGASDHQHQIEPWQTEDGWDVLECILCGDQW